MTYVHRRLRERSLSLIAALAMLALIPVPTVKAESDQGVKVLGRLPQPADSTGGAILLVDGTRRLMYFVRGSTKDGDLHLSEYDLRTRIPSIKREAVPSDFPVNFSRDLIAFDAKRRRMFALDIWSGGSGTIVHRFDLGTLKAEEAWDIRAALPGFEATGITYSPEDDRIYLIGDLSGAGFVHDTVIGTQARPPGPPIAIVALEAATAGPTVAWFKPVQGCFQHLSVYGFGGFIGRSAKRDALYFFCFSGGANVVTFPGVTGLVRMSMTSDSTQADALGFPTELFPVSGAFTGPSSDAVGAVTIDRPSDRVFVQSLSRTTPGAWAFDGTISSWVGLIAAPNDYDQNLGVNEGTGHYYIGTALQQASGAKDGYLIVSNARMTPPPQGDVLQYPVNGPIVTDPGSKRMFIPFLGPPGKPGPIVVFEDNTADPEPPEAVDYDDLTLNVPEGPGTLATFSGGSTGFGARAFVVGGVGGARSFVDSGEIENAAPVNVTQLARDLQLPVPALKPGDRGLYLGRGTTVDLSNSGSTASVQPVALDDLSADDFDNFGLFVDATIPPAAGQLVWPWPAAACLDGTGERQDVDRPGTNANAHASCDLAKNTSDGSTYAHAVSVGPVSIGGSSFTGSATRDAALGTVAKATSVARAVEVSVPGAGTLTIGRVTAIARTVAHGRPGTARVEYARRIQDVSITDANGTETFACAASCDPEAVADAVNSAFGIKVRMDIPAADTIATARGAYARVQRSYRDYIGGQAQNNDSSFALPAVQVTVNNDSASKSRLLVQLAAIQASSIYGISLLPGEGFDDGSGGILPPVPGPEVPPFLGPPGVGGTNYVPVPYGVPVRTALPGGAFLLARSPKDIAIVMLIFILIAGVVASAYRRHSLIRHLEEAS